MEQRIKSSLPFVRSQGQLAECHDSTFTLDSKVHPITNTCLFQPQEAGFNKRAVETYLPSGLSVMTW